MTVCQYDSFQLQIALTPKRAGLLWTFLLLNDNLTLTIVLFKIVHTSPARLGMNKVSC